MGKTIVFIEASNTGAGEACAREAQSLGMKTLLVTCNPKLYKIDLLCYIDVILVCNTRKTQLISNALNKYSNFSDIAGILTTNDFYVRQTSAIANKFKFPGIGVACSIKCHFKGELRKALDKPGLSDLNPKYALLDISKLDIASIFEFGQQVCYPCVVKPQDGNDSIGVRLLMDIEDYKIYFRGARKIKYDTTNQKFSQIFLFEELIIGIEFSVEIISYGQNKFAFVGAFHKVLWNNEKAPFIKIGAAFPYTGPATTLLEDASFRTLKAIGAEVGVFNIDCRVIAESNQVKILEVNGRIVGDQMGSHMIFDSYRQSLPRVAIELALNYKPVWITPTRYIPVAIYRILPDKVGIFRGIKNVDSIVLDASLIRIIFIAVDGHHCTEVNSNQDVIASIIATGNDIFDAIENAKRLSLECVQIIE